MIYIYMKVISLPVYIIWEHCGVVVRALDL